MARIIFAALVARKCCVNQRSVVHWIEHRMKIVLLLILILVVEQVKTDDRKLQRKNKQNKLSRKGVGKSEGPVVSKRQDIFGSTEFDFTGAIDGYSNVQSFPSIKDISKDYPDIVYGSVPEDFRASSSRPSYSFSPGFITSSLAKPSFSYRTKPTSLVTSGPSKSFTTSFSNSFSPGSSNVYIGNDYPEIPASYDVVTQDNINSPRGRPTTSLTSGPPTSSYTSVDYPQVPSTQPSYTPDIVQGYTPTFTSVDYPQVPTVDTNNYIPTNHHSPTYSTYYQQLQHTNIPPSLPTIVDPPNLANPNQYTPSYTIIDYPDLPDTRQPSRPNIGVANTRPTSLYADTEFLSIPVGNSITVNSPTLPGTDLHPTVSSPTSHYQHQPEYPTIDSHGHHQPAPLAMPAIKIFPDPTNGNPTTHNQQPEYPILNSQKTPQLVPTFQGTTSGITPPAPDTDQAVKTRPAAENTIQSDKHKNNKKKKHKSESHHKHRHPPSTSHSVQGMSSDLRKYLNNIHQNLNRLNPIKLVPRDLVKIYFPWTASTPRYKSLNYKSSSNYNSKRRQTLKKIDEIHAMVKQLVENKKYDSYGSPINKHKKRFVTTQLNSKLKYQNVDKSLNKNIPAEIDNILQQLQVHEPSITSTIEQIVVDLSQSYLEPTKATEESVVQKIDNILSFLENKENMYK